jgi:hypothetical protein
MGDSHVPSAEFRAGLEDEVVRTFQRESQFADGPRPFERRGLRGLMILLTALVLGFGTEFAAGQVQTAQERSRLIEAATENRRIVAMRLALAEAALKQTRAGFETGVVSRESLASVEWDVQQVHTRLERLDSEIAEMRASAAPARDELWAPPVGGRDFVSERLTIEITAAQRVLNVAEQQLRDAERQLRVGTAGAGVVASAEADVRHARQDMALLLKRTDLRRQFLAQRLSSEAVARELERFEVESELERATADLRAAQERAALANQRVRIGTASELDAKRAELEALELSVALERLRLQLLEITKKD